METMKITLDAEHSPAYLQTYLLYNSPEFLANKPRPAVIICPGGGYFGTSDREAEPVALRFLARGYHVFVLRYSVQTLLPAPQLDLARALRTVREHAQEWLVEPNHIAVCGFSAGGHLAASGGVFWNKPFLYEQIGVEPDQIKPNALILSYPVINFDYWPRASAITEANGQRFSEAEAVFSMVLGEAHPSQEQKDEWSLDLHVSADTPPTFIWHTADDDVVYSQNALRFATALAEHKVPYELHVFESGVHGLSLADETSGDQPQFTNPSTQIWIDLALVWLKHQFR